MKHYTDADGLILCVIAGKQNVKNWIAGADYLDRSVPAYEEWIASVNRLLSGGLIFRNRKGDRFRLSAGGKYILRGGLWSGAVDWQLAVRKRITQYAYDETAPQTFFFPREEYDRALEEYTDACKKDAEKIRRKRRKTAAPPLPKVGRLFLGKREIDARRRKDFSDFIELQYLSPQKDSPRKIFNAADIRFDRPDSLFVRISDENFRSYHPCFGGGLHPDGSRSLDLHGINYYTKAQAREIAERAEREGLPDFERLTIWLSSVPENGFYLLGR